MKLYNVEVHHLDEQFPIDTIQRDTADQAIELAEQLVSEYEQRENADEFRIYIEHVGEASCFINELEGASAIGKSWL